MKEFTCKVVLLEISCRSAKRATASVVETTTLLELRVFSCYRSTNTDNVNITIARLALCLILSFFPVDSYYTEPFVTLTLHVAIEDGIIMR